jgi:hypothetical protein
MNILRVDFPELYRRHLCRHSQFGINVAHVVSVLGTYLSLCGLVYALVPSPWPMVAIVVPYLAILAFNIPFRVFLVNALFLVLIFATFLVLPPLPIWTYPIGVLLFYELQLVSHKVYTRETDMTEFNQKYPKGFVLKVLLSIYELPILLNYLFFGKKDWCISSDQSTVCPDLGASRFGERTSHHADARDSTAV